MTEIDGRVDLERMGKAYEDSKERYLANPGSSTVTLRATAKLVKNAYLEGRIGKYHFACDEPVARGGEDAAASPLEYFLAGAAF